MIGAKLIQITLQDDIIIDLTKGTQYKSSLQILIIPESALCFSFSGTRYLFLVIFSSIGGANLCYI